MYAWALSLGVRDKDWIVESWEENEVKCVSVSSDFGASLVDKSNDWTNKQVCEEIWPGINCVINELLINSITIHMYKI